MRVRYFAWFDSKHEKQSSLTCSDQLSLILMQLIK